ncbi:MAG: 2-phospho-L-lactate guanylyltransferase [Mycobacteriales bacterium]
MEGWAVVVPVKRLERAKTRLVGAVPGVPHGELVLAITLDTLAAAGACAAVERIVVVSDDPVARRAVTALSDRMAVVPDVPDAGLNPALEYGAAQAAGTAAGVATLSADLAALRPGELAAALEEALAHPRSFVADAAGTGTTLLAARAGTALRPEYGPGSAAAHARSGAVPLAGAWPSLRRDLDTPADLYAAAALGLGPRTAALMAATLNGVQGTVKDFDPESRSGHVLLDDGSEVVFGTAAFDAGGLRLLRLGQRVRMESGSDGEVRRITLVTMP